MLPIHDNQVEVFKKEALKNFEDEMLEHIKTYFPNHYNAMQEVNVRATIQYGYVKATAYGFTTIRNVCLYLNNMILLGSNFDLDPQYPWAREILTDKDVEDAVTRIDTLSTKTLEEISKVTGEGNLFIFRAILNFTKNADDIYKRLKEGYLNKTLFHLKILFNKKYEVVGEVNLHGMIKCGVRNAPQYGITEESNVLVFIAFMFMMGSGFDKDPQYPWIGSILNDPLLTNQNNKIEMLYKTTIDRLRTALSRYNH